LKGTNILLTWWMAGEWGEEEADQTCLRWVKEMVEEHAMGD
jgi:hypothetical protein